MRWRWASGVLLLLLGACGVSHGALAEARRKKCPVQIQLLMERGDTDGLAAAVLGFLRARGFDAQGVGLALGWVHPDRKPIPGFTRAWDEAASGESDSVGLGLFRAGLAWYVSDVEYRERMEDVARRYPNEERVWLCLGRARLKVGDYAAAGEGLEKVLDAGGASAKSEGLHVDLARCYARMGRREDAVQRIRVVEDERMAAYGIAVAMALDLPEEAERLHRRVAHGGYGCGMARLGLIDALRALGRDDEAREQVRILRKESPSEIGGHALGYFDVVHEMGSGPTMARAFMAVGIVWVAWQDTRRFMGFLPWILRRIPPRERESYVAACESIAGPAEVAPLMAVVAARLHQEWFSDPAKALAVVERAERKRPDSAWVVQEKGEILRRLNRHQEMAAAYERVADLDAEGRVVDVQVLTQQLMHAMSVYWGMGQYVGVLRTGLRILSRGEVFEGQARHVRNYLKSLFRARGEYIWNDLREVRFERPTGDAARKTAEEIGRLSDDDVGVREAAQKALRRIGVAALPSLLDFADSGDSALRARARDLVRAILTEEEGPRTS